MPQPNTIPVALNGYAAIGKRVAAVIGLQEDMSLVGIADVGVDWRLRVATLKGIHIYGAAAAAEAMRRASLPMADNLAELIEANYIFVDFAPKHVGAANAAIYRCAGKPLIVQGGERHDLTGLSFVPEARHDGAVGRSATRVVSWNTTSLARTRSAHKRAGLSRPARGTLPRRAIDPGESDHTGIVNTLVPQPELPSHQGPGRQSVDPCLDVVTVAEKVPETVGHLHYWSVLMTRVASKAQAIDAFLASSRIAPTRTDKGFVALNSAQEMMADLGRPHGDLDELDRWVDMLKVQRRELYYACMDGNQAIVMPQTVDAIRALHGRIAVPAISIAKTHASRGIGVLRGSSLRSAA